MSTQISARGQSVSHTMTTDALQPYDLQHSQVQSGDPGSNSFTVNASNETTPDSIPRRPCEGCRCLCHIRHKVKMPASLSRWFGTLTIYHTGIPLIASSCDDAMCSERQSTGLEFFYRFPVWLFDRIVHFQGYVPGGLPYCLRLNIGGVVPEDSAMLRYCQYNDEINVRRDLAGRIGYLNDYDDQGNPLLLVAASHGAYEVVEFLISYGADIRRENASGLNTEQMILQSSLLGRPLYEQTGSSTALQPFWQSSSLLVLQRSRKEVLDDSQFSCIQKCVLGLAAVDLEEQLEYLQSNIDIKDSWGRTALHWAAFRGDFSSVCTLLESGADPLALDVDEWAPLHAAAWSGCVTVLLELIKWGSDPEQANSAGDSPLHIAASSHDNNQCVEKLLHNGAGWESLNKRGRTPLMEAVRYRRQANTKTLLECGVYIDSENQCGETAFLISIRWDAIDCISLLLENDADYLIQDKCGDSVLHVAAWRAGLQTVEKLETLSMRYLKSGTKNKSGQTAQKIANLCRSTGEWCEPREWHVGFRQLLQKFDSTMDPSVDHELSDEQCIDGRGNIEDSKSVLSYGKDKIGTWMHFAGSPCVAFLIAIVSSICISLSLALWLSFNRNDISGGFTVGGYILAVTLTPIGFTYARHTGNCSCAIMAGSREGKAPDDDDSIELDEVSGTTGTSSAGERLIQEAESSASIPPRGRRAPFTLVRRASRIHDGSSTILLESTTADEENEVFYDTVESMVS
jgi:ankyrin repeat protein